MSNIVQDALEKLRTARRARADYDRQVADGVKMFERNTGFLCDLVSQELPLKTRDECVLLTDEQYAQYSRKHFAQQLAVVIVIAREYGNQPDPESEPDFDDMPTNLEF